MLWSSTFICVVLTFIVTLYMHAIYVYSADRSVSLLLYVGILFSFIWYFIIIKCKKIYVLYLKA